MSTGFAVVTGASAGIGEAFARELASQGANVALVARNESQLYRVSIGLEREYGVSTLVLPTDLTDEDQRAALIERLGEDQIHTLVNNAGFASMGNFAQLDPDRVTREVQLNVLALTQLTHAVVPQMLGRNRGAIINVSSSAAFQPIPQMAVYAATKAYVLSFSNALWGELRATGVRVVCICPGPTDTAFFTNAGDGSVMRGRRRPEQVVASTFAALRTRQPYVVDGPGNKLLAQLGRVTPTGVAVRVANWVATH